jgi:PleD family two-component response regulator
MENKKVNVLLIEDSVDDAELIRRKLEKSVDGRFKVTVAQRLNQGLEMLEKEEPDLILSDLGLPDSHGLDTVTKILLAAPHIPLVVLSGFDDEDVAIKAVQSGAQDYLVKGHLESYQLERSLYYSIERARLQAELDQNAQEMSRIHANLLKILEKSSWGRGGVCSSPIRRSRVCSGKSQKTSCISCSIISWSPEKNRR